jgi:hypothetical protein
VAWDLTLIPRPAAAADFGQIAYDSGHAEVPFAPLTKPLSESAIALLTTSSLYDRTPADAREVASGLLAEPPDRLFGNDLSWHKKVTHLDDLDSFFPVNHLKDLVATGRLGRLARRFHCLPTSYSHRQTTETDAPEVLRRLQEDEVDVALLIPL